MSHKKKIFAISGSTRAKSTNLNLLRAIADLYKDEIEVHIFEGLALLPQFNPDEEADDAVKKFRQQVKEADGVLICTPEYAHGVPGALKNAIDWAVSSNEFSHKPTALITASTDGSFAHTALIEVLKTIEAKNIEQLQLLIQFSKTKVSSENIITDEKTLVAVKKLIDDLIATIEKNAA